METNRKPWVIGLVLGVLVVGLTSKPASAQVFRGKFTLPSEVRWGMATLPAGDYSFGLDKKGMDGLVTVYRGARPVAIIPHQGANDPKQERSLIVVEAGRVRELSLPQIGETLCFAAHNPTHRAAPQEKELAQAIPVTAVGAAGR